MRNYPKCWVCGKSVGWYDRKAHLKCLKGKNHHCSKRAKPFYQCDKNGVVLVRWRSVGEMERVAGYKQKAVKKALHGELKTHRGYVWKYVENL